MRSFLNKKEKGFTLLFAIFVAILVLSVGASIISVALKQSILSSTGRESQYAFYAANSALECALFWDLNPGAAGGSGVERVFPYDGSEGGTAEDSIHDYDDVVCGWTEVYTGDEVGTSEIAFTDGWSGGSNSFTFEVAFGNDIDNGPGVPDINDFEYCAQVTVEKGYDSGEAKLVTSITSRGYNTCDPANEPRAVERGLLMQYTSSAAVEE